MCNATFARILMVPVVVLCVAAPVTAADPPKDGASEKAVRQQMDDSCKASVRRVYVHA